MKYYVWGFIWRDDRGRQIGEEQRTKSNSAILTHVSSEIGAFAHPPKPKCRPQILWRETHDRQ